MKQKQEIWEEHPVVCHYTTQAGLTGILDTNQLWATSYKCLNDTSEVGFFRSLAKKALLPQFQEISESLSRKNSKAQEAFELIGGRDVVAKRDFDAFLQTLYNVTFSPRKGFSELVHPFVTSFCTHAEEYEARNGLLSQWRGYGAGGGFCLEINTKALCDMLQAEYDSYSYTISKIYDVSYGVGDEVLEEYSEEISIISELIYKYFDGKKDDFHQLFKPFTKLTTCLKHIGFKEEREVRIVKSPVLKNAPDAYFADQKLKLKEIQMRPTDRGMVSFIKLFDEREVQLPIRKVIVGPSINQDRSFDAVRFAVADRDVEVVKSETPFVG